MFNITDYAYNIGTWNTALQIKNTLSTDFAYRYDHETNQLYINVSSGIPDRVTIEYIPRFDNVEEVKSDFWIDVLMRYSVALTKIALGRIRSRFKSSSSLWEQDGETILSEGTEELKELREQLLEATQLQYPVD